MIANKKALRLQYKSARKLLNTETILHNDACILTQFSQLPLANVSNVLIYNAMLHLNEPTTELIADFLKQKNPDIKIAAPRIDRSGATFEAVAIAQDATYMLHEYQILEPQGNELIAPDTIDLVILPMFIFDQSGYRVGFGKGMYDRFLAQSRPETLKIGICYFEPVEKITDVDEYDIRMDLCITPSQVYEFK